jgi:hypothetical protein
MMEIIMKMNKYLLFALVCLGSCATPKHIKKKLNKYNERHPEVVADFTRTKYPCILLGDTIVRIDTSYKYFVIDCPDSTITSQNDTIYLDKNEGLNEGLKKINEGLKVVHKSVHRVVAVPQQTKIITKIVKDSAELLVSEMRLQQVQLEKDEQIAKTDKAYFWVRLLLTLLFFSLILNIILSKKK